LIRAMSFCFSLLMAAMFFPCVYPRGIWYKMKGTDFDPRPEKQNNL
jgi:hypothetical protein